MNDLIFKCDQNQPTHTVSVTLDGKPISLPVESNLATALLSVGEMTSRISPTSHQPCSPHCLMGVCFECLMEIDGIQRQACLTKVEEGMVINRFADNGQGDNS